MFWIPSFSGHFSFRAIFVSVCFLLLLFLLFPLSTAGKKSRAMKRMKSTRSGREKERKKKKLCPAAREYTYVCMHVCARVYMASNFEYLWVHVRKVACTAATEKEGKGEKKNFSRSIFFFLKNGRENAGTRLRGVRSRCLRWRSRRGAKRESRAGPPFWKEEDDGEASIFYDWPELICIFQYYFSTENSMAVRPRLHAQ